MGKKPKNLGKEPKRRDFLKLGLLAGGATVVGAGINKAFSEDPKEESGEKVKVLNQDGELVEVDKSHIKPVHKHKIVSNDEARKGIPGRKFVMVIDLSRCKNARKCMASCQEMHHLPSDRNWLKVYKMQHSEETSPYWMPKGCFHCDASPCVKVCPVDATFKRQDGIVLVDNERCIGCRFCMAACPYSTRVFNWGRREIVSKDDHYNEYSPETGVPGRIGTVEKCDFCPDMIRDGMIPACVTACPNGVFYFGDMNEDAVTNGDETVRFSELIKDKAGYRFLEDLGTEPSVYYLPPVSRLFPFKDMEENDIQDG